MSWRKRSRAVAYVDLVDAALHVLFAVLCASLAASEKLDDSELLEGAGLIAKTSVLVVEIAASTLQLYAAVQLLNGTETNADKHTALKNSRFWRNSSIIFIVIIAGVDVLLFGRLKMVFDVILRFAFMLVVFKFVQELEITPNENTL